jgi:hypothetical protein
MLGISLAYADDVCVEQVKLILQYAIKPSEYSNDYLISFPITLTMYQPCATFLFNRTFKFFL